MKRLVLVLLLLCALQSGAMATITRVQVVKANTGTAGAAAMTFTTTALTAGNYVVIVGVTTQFSTVRAIAGGVDKDLAGGLISYGANTSNGVFTYILFYRVITGGQTSVTVSLTSGNITTSGILAEYSGKNITPDVWRTGNTGNSATLTTNTTDTTNYANELVVAAMGFRCCASLGYSTEQTAWASTPTNGFTIVLQSSTFINTTNNDRAIAYLEQIVTSAGAQSTGVSTAGAVIGQFAAPIVTFREIPQVVTGMGGL